ncbi:MAG: serine hydrolase domain-containing protein [Blastococcus sp.]
MDSALQPDLEERVDRILNRHPAVGLAVGVVRDGALVQFAGRGFADVAAGTPITEDTVVRVGSITKTFTAIAVLQLCERGLVDLDAPAAGYLRTFRLVQAEPGWPPVTLRHLLTHTAGIGEVLRPAHLLRPVFGEMVRQGRPVPELAEYYRAGLRVRAEPGTRWRYTGHGFAAVGQIVADVSGQPLDRYLRERVFQPLGMADTELRPTERLRARLATGYALRSGGARPVPPPEQVTAAAGSAVSTPGDLARFVAALLGRGANRHGSVLSPATQAAMFAPQYRPDPRIPGMGLAFFRGRADGHAVVEHGGVVPGFDSELFLAPEDGAGVLAVTNGTRAGMFWLPPETERLLRSVLGVADETIRSDVPHHPEIWRDLCGRYLLPGPVTDARARGMAGAGAEVVVRRGRLLLRVLSPVPAALRGFALHPDDPADPYVFRIDLTRFGLDTMRVVFSRDGAGATTAVHVDRGQFLSAHRSKRRRGES